MSAVLKDEPAIDLPFTGSVRRADLVRALKLVTMATERRSMIPILGYVLIEACARDRLRITGTDLDKEISVEIPARNAAGATTLPGRTLSHLVATLWEEDVHFGFASGRASLTCGEVTASMLPLSPEDWPRLDAGEVGGSMQFPEGVLGHLLEGVGFAISTEETRYYLNGIRIEFEADKEILAVATNGHQLATRSAPAPESTGELGGFTIPRRALAAIHAAAQGREASVDLFWSESKTPEGKTVRSITKLRVCCGDVTVLTKTIDGPYPDWRRVMPKEPGGFIRISRANLARALRVIPKSVFCPAIQIIVSPSGVSLAHKHPDWGEIAQPLAADVVGLEPMSFGVNVNYLKNSVGALALPGTDAIRLHVIDPGSPLTIVADSDLGPDRSLITPMRVWP